MDRLSRVLVPALCGLLVALPIPASPEGGEFIRREGNHLVIGDAGKPVRLRGVNFNNYFFEEDPALILESDHHSAIDFQRVAAVGMNVVRFNLSYRVFENDQRSFVYEQAGWDWLDQNIAWAKQAGIYLIVDMHVPQGGYQGGTEDGLALWKDRINQERLKALWRAIAARYQNETQIAAWDLLNEATPPDPMSWPILAAEIAEEIRSVDRNHLLIVEQALSTGDAAFPLFLLNDGNVMYDFHYYYPDEYTHQYLASVNQADGGHYPNPDVSVLPSESVPADEIANPRVPAGNSPWTFYRGELYRVRNPLFVEALPSFSCEVNAGTVYFDDFVINEYDETQNWVRQVMSIDIIEEEPDEENVTLDPFESVASSWSSWSSDGGGSHALVTDGHRGPQSLAIKNVSESYNLSHHAFAIRQDYYYRIDGWMKGRDVTGGSCYITLEFGQLPPGGAFTPVDKNYLRAKLTELTAFGAANGVPMNVGEFGLSRWTFLDGRGGLKWVRDLLAAFEESGVNYQYWDYHSFDFGLYATNSGLPDPERTNQALIDLLTTSLQPR